MRTWFLILSGATRRFRRAVERVRGQLLLRGNGALLSHSVIVNGLPSVRNYGRLELGARVMLNSGPLANPVGGGLGMSLTVARDGVLTIGDEAGLSNCEIYCTSRMEIGKRVLVGGGVCLYDTDFHAIRPEQRLRSAPEPARTAPIKIGDDVFIGGRAIILKGVTVGDGSVIGAGSVVSRDVPAGEIWAGNPARFVRKV